MTKIKYAIELLKNHGKYVGLAGGIGEKDIKTWSSLDIDMLFAGADWCFVYNQGKATLQMMQKKFLDK